MTRTPAVIAIVVVIATMTGPAEADPLRLAQASGASCQAVAKQESQQAEAEFEAQQKTCAPGKTDCYRQGRDAYQARMKQIWDKQKACQLKAETPKMDTRQANTWTRERNDWVFTDGQLQRWAFGPSFTDTTGVTWTLDRNTRPYEGSGTTWANYVNGTRYLPRNGRRLKN